MSRLYHCNECDATFAHPGAVRVHHRAMHMSLQAYPRFLFVHRRTHMDDRPYQCDLCDATFAAPGNLTTHKRTHTSERPFCCQQCDLAFVTFRALDMHQRAHASQELINLALRFQRIVV